MPISWDRVKTLIVLSKAGSFSAAARELGVSQPCVSRQIRQLEAELGTSLLVRDTHGLNLTTAGRRLVESLKSPFNRLEEAWQVAARAPTQIHGAVAVGCLPEIGQSLFFKAILGFTDLHPAVHLEVDYSEGSKMLERLRKGELQFAILGHAPSVEMIRSYRIMEERSVLVTRKANEKSFDRLRKNDSPLPFVTYRPHDLLLYHFMKQFRKSLGIKKIEETIIVNAHKSMIDTLLTKDVYAVIPLHRVQGLIDAGDLVQVASAVLKTGVYLVHHERNEWTQRETEFKKYLISALKDVSRG